MKPEIFHCGMKSGRSFRDLASLDDVASGLGDGFYSTDKGYPEVIGEICIVKSDQAGLRRSRYLQTATYSRSK